MRIFNSRELRFLHRLVLAATMSGIAIGTLSVRAADAENDESDYSGIPLLKWVGPGQPGTHAEYLQTQDQRTIEMTPLFRSTLKELGNNKLIVLVNGGLRPSIQTKLDTYVDDLQNAGYTVSVYDCNYGTAEQLKAFLQTEAEDLLGCTFIGNIPCAWFEVANDYAGSGNYGYTSFPCDLFLTDLDGAWTDAQTISPMQAGVYDSHTAGTGDMAPEIFIGRIDASQMSGDTEANQTNAYLQKLHNCYVSGTTVGTAGLTYTEDDWASHSYFQTDIAYAYPTYQAIVAPKTNRADYRSNQLPLTTYEFVQLSCHSSSQLHQFTRGGELYNTELRAVPPQAVLYNLFCCSGCRFTDSNFMGGAYIFNSSSTSLAAVGSTKTGSMLEFYQFYQPLGAGKSFGQSLKEWFEAQAPYDASEVYWHYGMSIIGDPCLSRTIITRPAYTVTYDANGATSGMPPAPQAKTHDMVLTLATNSGNLAKTASTFAGWNTAADGNGTSYAEGASYTANASATLYAKWTTSSMAYTITFFAGTGGAISGTTPQTLVSGGICSPVMAIPETGYSFVNWTSNLGTTYTNISITVGPVTDNQTWTANFVKNASPGQLLKLTLNASYRNIKTPDSGLDRYSITCIAQLPDSFDMSSVGDSTEVSLDFGDYSFTGTIGEAFKSRFDPIKGGNAVFKSSSETVTVRLKKDKKLTVVISGKNTKGTNVLDISAENDGKFNCVIEDFNCAFGDSETSHSNYTASCNKKTSAKGLVSWTTRGKY